MSETCIHCQSWRDDCNEYLTEIESLRQQLTEAQEAFDRACEMVAKMQERAEKAEALYQDLIMQVACKFPNESRHETAKRYISERENTEAVECKEVE